jgi:ABC-type bacteriocin/lantibiotic exporter with double-glycine peptidase domain
MTHFLSNEERNQIEEYKNGMKSELSRLRNKINNFIVIEILSIILTISFIYKYLTLFSSNPILAWSIILAFVLSQVLLLMATRVALDYWKLYQRMVELYEMSDEEFNRKFAEFCKK